MTERNICTRDKVNGRCCSNGDSGGPLVINGRLAGVMSWNDEIGDPDVFVSLVFLGNRNWILANISPNLSNSRSPQTHKNLPNRQRPHP